MMDGLSAYSYKPLGDGDIRLFRLASRPALVDFRIEPVEPRANNTNNDCKLEGELKAFPLSEAPSYTALSYMWGADEVKDKIKCVYLSNGVLRIRRNLYDFLQQLRNKKSKSWIWIDSICINQDLETENALSERIEQIRVMDTIFAKASVVVTWLGAFRTVDEGTNGQSSNPIRKIHWREEALHHGYQLPPDPEPLQDICQKKYWSRYWIIQEVVVAESIELWLGDQTMMWEDFQKLLSQYNMGSERPCLLHQERGRSTNATLPDLIEKYQDWDCSRQHDRVYALLGLVGKWRDKRVIIKDYEVHPAVLHHMLLRECDEDRRAEIFHFSEFLHKLLKRIDAQDPKLNLRSPPCPSKEPSDTDPVKISGYLIGWIDSFFDPQTDPFKEPYEYLKAKPELTVRKDEILKFTENMRHLDDKFFNHASPTLALTSEDDAAQAILNRKRWQVQTQSQYRRTPSWSQQWYHSSPQYKFTRRQFFSIKHATGANSEPGAGQCYCNGFTESSVERKDIVVQFQDSQIALILSRQRWQDASAKWQEFKLKGKAVMARGCCRRQDTQEHGFFSLPDLKTRNCYPEVTVLLRAADLMDLTKPMLKQPG